MRFAVVRFLHPQEEHFELLLESRRGIRCWWSQWPFFAGAGYLNEEAGGSRRYLDRVEGSYMNVGIWWRLAGGRCSIAEEGPDRIVVRPHDPAGQPFVLERRSKQTGLGARWRFRRIPSCASARSA